VNSQLEKVTAEMSKKVQEALGDKLPVPLPEGLEGLLPGLGKKGETEGKKEEKKPTPGDLLERLF
jgi:hypothetical protein